MGRKEGRNSLSVTPARVRSPARSRAPFLGGKEGRKSFSVTTARVRSPARSRGPFLGGKEGRKEITLGHIVTVTGTVTVTVTLGHSRPGSFSRTLTGAFFRWEGRKEGKSLLITRRV